MGRVKTSFKNSKIKISYSKLNNSAMRKRSKSQQRAKLQPKNYKKPSPQTVLPSLSKDFDKRIEAILSIPPERAKKLRDKWKREQEEGEKKQGSK